MPPTNNSHLNDADIAALGRLFEKHGASIAKAIANRHESELADAISAMTEQVDKAIQAANKNTNDALSRITRRTDDEFQKIAGLIARSSSKKPLDWAAIVGVPLAVMVGGFTMLQSNLNTTLEAYREGQRESLSAYEKVQDSKIRVMAARIDIFEERFVGLQEASDRNFDILTSSLGALSDSIMIAIGIQPQTGKPGDKTIELPVRNAPE